jgi:hypothetical protein
MLYNLNELKIINRDSLQKSAGKELTGGEWRTMNGAHVYVKDGKVAAGAHGALSMSYVRVKNKQKTKNFGSQYGQDIEPHGEYISHDSMDGKSQLPENDHASYEYGKIHFKNPLYLEHNGTGHGGWKTELSEKFGGKKGKALSTAIKKAGHDGIVTIDSKYGHINETVNLAGEKSEHGAEPDKTSKSMDFDLQKAIKGTTKTHAKKLHKELPAGGVWRTMNGHHIYILNGQIIAGASPTAKGDSLKKMDKKTVGEHQNALEAEAKEAKKKAAAKKKADKLKAQKAKEKDEKANAKATPTKINEPKPTAVPNKKPKAKAGTPAPIEPPKVEHSLKPKKPKGAQTTKQATNPEPIKLVLDPDKAPPAKKKPRRRSQLPLPK